MRKPQVFITAREIYLFEIESVKANKYLTEEERAKKIAELKTHIPEQYNLKSKGFA